MAESSTSERPASTSLIGGHRADIETLRAIAVVSVVLYHADVPGFAGGYVGVDVFFALSGYLMTGLLVAEHWRAGGIALGAFYARRARRLLPGAVLVLTATAVASMFIYAPIAARRVAADATWSGLYAVNYRFASASTDYLGADVGESPLQHYWSLAVEEQFYLVWPLLLAACLFRTSRLRLAVVALGTLSVASFGFATWLMEDHQPWAFFSLPSRAWEFGVGGLAALVGVRFGARNALVRGGLVIVGLLMVLASVTLFDSRTLFPAPWAALPVVGTAMVLVAGRSGGIRPGAEGREAHLLDRLLHCQAGQWIGARSYAIYLWHWPPLILVPEALGRSMTAAEVLAVLVAATLVAVAAHKFVENPVRYAQALRPTGRSISLAAGLTAVAVGVPVAISSSTAVSTSTGVTADAPTLSLSDADGPRPLPDNLTPSLEAVNGDVSLLSANGCEADRETTDPGEPCRFGADDADRTMVLFGDSHMSQWFPTFDQFGAEDGWSIVPMTKRGCPSITIEDLFNRRLGRTYDECNEWRAAVIDYVNQTEPEVVILGNAPGWFRSPSDPPDSTGWKDRWEPGLTATVRQLRDATQHVVVLGPLPVMIDNVPECLSANAADTRPCDLDRATRLPASMLDEQRAISTSVGADFADVTSWLCGDTTCPSVAGNIIVYRDNSHISDTFAATQTPNLRRALDDLGVG